jgi:uncharacterized protein
MSQFGKRGVQRPSAPSAPSTRVARHAMAPVAAQTYDTYNGTAGVASYDEGLRAYMLNIYNLMFLGVAFSGAVTLLLISMPDVLERMSANPFYGLAIFLGTFGLSWCSPMIINTGSAVVGHVFYWLYCALWGAGLAPLISFLIHEDASQVITTSFFLAASLFGAASLYGYTTRRSLTGLGTYLCMLSVGLLAACVLNLFVFEFSGFCFLVCIATVVIFTAITAWETQVIKDAYGCLSTSEQREAFSIFGAFQLYGSFMVIFSRLMRIMYQLQDE